MSARRCDGAARDEGYSLVELLVAMMVFAIVLAVVGNLFVQVSLTTTAAGSLRSATSTASTALDAVSKVIRQGAPIATSSSTVAAPAVVSGTATSLTLYSYSDVQYPTASPVQYNNPTPTKVSYAVNANGYLVETRTASVASGTYWVFTGATTSRTVAGPITTSATALFAYADSTNAALAPAAGGLTATQLAAVQTITVTITAPNTVRGTSNPVVLTNSVVLQNVALAQNGN